MSEIELEEVMEKLEIENEVAGGEESVVLPWLMAAADAGEWWKRMRRYPKRLGEVSQAAFLLRARTMGFGVALPWGDSERYDFMVWAKEGGRILRVQVKGTGRLHRGGYDIQPVHATRGRGKRRYTAREIDVLAAHVQPLDVWYLLPIGAIRGQKCLRLYPEMELGTCSGAGPGRWERYREEWDGLRKCGCLDSAE